MKELRLRGVEVITDATVKTIQDGAVLYADSVSDELEIIADTIILGLGTRPEASLRTKLMDAGFSVKSIGDAINPGNIGDAIESGFNLALTI
jgi:hypothetical protein